MAGPFGRRLASVLRDGPQEFDVPRVEQVSRERLSGDVPHECAASIVLLNSRAAAQPAGGVRMPSRPQYHFIATRQAGGCNTSLLRELGRRQRQGNEVSCSRRRLRHRAGKPYWDRRLLVWVCCCLSAGHCRHSLSLDLLPLDQIMTSSTTR
jgi:hypothetical protein